MTMMSRKIMKMRNKRIRVMVFDSRSESDNDQEDNKDEE